MLPKSENRYTTYWKKKNFDPNFKSQVEKSIIDDEIGELKTQGVKDAIAQLHQEGKITIKTFKSNDKQTLVWNIDLQCRIHRRHLHIITCKRFCYCAKFLFCNLKLRHF